MKRFIPAVLCVLFFACVPSYPIDEENFITSYLWRRFTGLTPAQRPRIALVLGGGGARGLAHIGVLKVFIEEKVPVDMVVGTSVGALVGGLYAGGVTIDRIENMGENVGWKDLTNISDTALVRLLLSNHLLSTEKMEKYLESTLGRRRFDELQIPFACVSTDLITGERIVLREGDVVKAIRASSTIPGVFDPVEYRHRYLVDGGIFDNTPADVAKFLGADFVIAVAVPGDFSRNKMSNVYLVMAQALYIQGQALDVERLKLADFEVYPKVGDVSSIDLGRSKECIEAGIRAAREAMPKIKRMLIERTSDCYLLQ